MPIVALVDWRVHRIGTNGAFKELMDTGRGRNQDPTILVVDDVIIVDEVDVVG